MSAVGSDEALTAWLALSLAFSPRTGAALLRAVGAPEVVLGCTDAQLEPLIGQLPTARLRRIQRGDAVERVRATRHWLSPPNRTLLTLADPAYPRRLLHLADPPLLIYVAGERSGLERPMIAVVGSRTASAQGRLDAAAFAGELARRGWTIASGMAFGIDAAAHRGVLEVKQRSASSGSTVAVVATGPDVAYPREHADLADQITQHGAIMTEWPPGYPARAMNFPRRNRLIAALADGVVIIEAAERSGSLITARLANELGREVFALPGTIHSPASRGSHRLIREGAVLARNVDDIEHELRHDAVAAARRWSIQRPATNCEPASSGPRRTGSLTHDRNCTAPVLEADERPGEPKERSMSVAAPDMRKPARTRPVRGTGAQVRSRIERRGGADDGTPLSESARTAERTAQCVLDALGHAPATLDQLLDRTGLDAAQVAAALLALEMAGTVARAPGNVYERLTNPA